MPARAVAVPFLIDFEVRVMSRVIKSSASQAVKPGPSPRFVPPQLVDKPPSGRQWLHEIKLDGFRMAARIDNGRAQLFTRSFLSTHSSGTIRRGCQCHLYERSSLVTRRTEVRLRVMCSYAELFLCERCAGNNRGACGVGRRARLDFLPPSPRARLLARLRASARAGFFCM
jgi:hypothetical protein